MVWQLLQQGAAMVLLDCREPEELALASLPGALHIPMNEIPLRVKELNPEADIVVFCHHGIRSQQVANYLERMGFDKLNNLVGGINAWAREVDPKMATY